MDIKEISVEIDVDELCKEAIKVFKNLDLENKKQVVRDIIDRIVVKERRRVEVWAQIPINIKPATLKLGHVVERRDSGTA